MLRSPLASMCAALAGGLMLGATGATADVLTVALDGSGDYTAIQEAIDASVDGDEILVAEGVYEEHLSLVGKAIDIVGRTDEPVVIIDGTETGRVLHVRDVQKGECRIEGVVFTGGTAGDLGGGVRVDNARIRMEACVIRGNTVHKTVGCAWCTGNRVRGGGMALHGGTNATLVDCRFEENVIQLSLVAYGANGQARGGGLYVENAVVSMDACRFLGNDAVAEDYPPNCANCNWPATGVGGAICVAGGGDLTVTGTEILDSELWGHKASYGLGAGVAVMGGSATFSQCLVRGNVSAIPPNCNCGPEKNWGGGFYVDEGGSLVVTQCDIASNAVSGTSNDLGSVLCVVDGTAELASNTMCANVGTAFEGAWIDAGGNVLTAICCEGGDEIDSDQDGTCDVADECPLDPGKVVPGICGCGTPDLDSDADGVLDCNDLCPFDPTRIEPTPCGCGSAASSDLNGDLIVDPADLGILLAFWRDAEAFPLADLNFDGQVNSLDLGLILSHWGPCKQP